MHRPLGSTEHILCLYDRVAPLHFAIAGEIVGEFSDRELEIALIKVRQKHPLLQVCIKYDRTKQPWFITEKCDIPLKIVERKEELTWQQEVKLELARPFVWDEAPLIRVILVRGSDSSELIVVCHHSIADGLSSCYLLRDILEAIAYPDRTNLSLSEYPPFEDLIPNLDRPKGDRLPTEFVPDLREKSVISSCEIDPQIISWSLPSSKSTLLAHRARQEKTTVHGAICAAFLLAIASTKKLSTFKCQSPINIRKYLTPAIEEDFGFYFSVAITEHSIGDRRSFWEIARSLKEQLKEKMHPDRIFASIPDRQALMSTKPTPSQIQQLFHSDKYYYDLVVTNLGRLNFPKHYGSIELKAVYGPAVMNHAFNDLIVGVTSVRNEIFFTLTYSASKPIAIEVNNIKLEAIEHLDRAL